MVRVREYLLTLLSFLFLIRAYSKKLLRHHLDPFHGRPSAPIDEDIILSMPNLDFDQYIGDPRDQYNEQYTGLTTARNLYWQKYAGPNNFWDYMRLIKYYDNSIFDLARKFMPARANTTFGIVIEPNIFERPKIVKGKNPTLENTFYTSSIDIAKTKSAEAGS